MYTLPIQIWRIDAKHHRAVLIATFADLPDASAYCHHMNQFTALDATDLSFTYEIRYTVN